ncbi:MAG: RNA 2',3'-cyclic phosphodiesterase [Armatimonadetes bacterium]|nr:RNA 2',3'-cyclic phosphodiesterase [Armatimonadota bacterium]
MKVIRTFVAVLIDEGIRRRIAEVQEQLKKFAVGVKWVAPENLHITLKFLGDVREDELPRVHAAVGDAVKGMPRFEMSFGGLGAFPNLARARVVWVGIEDGREELRELAARVDENLAKLGFEKEDRPFRAHVTIGRVKDGGSVSGLALGIEEIDARELGSQQVLSVAVMESELSGKGPVYSPLSESKLG